MPGTIPVQLLLGFIPFLFNSCQALLQVVGFIGELRQPLSWCNSWPLMRICILSFEPCSKQLDESSSAALLSPHSIAAEQVGNVVFTYNTYVQYNPNGLQIKHSYVKVLTYAHSLVCYSTMSDKC